MINQEKADAIVSEIKESGKRIEEIILEKEIIPEAALFNLKSENFKIPLKEVVVEEVPLKILELIPEETARYYKMIPLDKKIRP